MKKQWNYVDRLFKIVLFLILLLTSAMVDAGDTQAFTFGIVPQQSATVLAEKWAPILRYLSEQTGYHLIFKTASTIPIFEERVQASEYDLVYINPVHYTVFAKSPGYRAFAKQRNQLLKGIVVVRQESSLTRVAELAGQTLAFPAPAAFGASVLVQGYFKQNGMVITPQYVGSHDSVYQGVANGRFIAGGGIQRTFDALSSELQKKLRILWVTDGYTPHAFAAHPRVPAEVVKKIQTTLVDMVADPHGKVLLEKIEFNYGAEEATDSDWDVVRSLNITELPR